MQWRALAWNQFEIPASEVSEAQIETTIFDERTIFE